MTITSALSRAFMFGLNDVQTEGLQQFLDVLDRRRSGPPTRGLITVSNHISVLDDPLIWGVLPLRYNATPQSSRWGLGAHDICFKNSFFTSFFSLGQVLPTYRLLHSPYGGLYQSTVTQAIRLLSGPGAFYTPSTTFSAGARETFAAPAFYANNRNAWVHVFPEGCVHQHPDHTLRYFKWGVSRLILESEPAPELVPIFIDGYQNVMPEDRKWPRWLPRIGSNIRVIYGEAVNIDDAFREPRSRWKRMVKKQEEATGQRFPVGEVPEVLRDHPEAVQLRKEVAKTVRDMVQKLRLRAGYPVDDPSYALAEAWGRDPKTERFRSPVDDSWVRRE
ncbi:Lysophosphatidylcholine acyltransferase [Colletotrichum orbiculare MAFF 240422]|uniref:Tafazzin family protein n=1 Tax=Colletotrichum orbiculare (strain 104-T / ATCC 96160 / CBS 514.97 / LARS 414 / MAFF 240422) TaxID=1213857 RepID=A0A484FRI4_COLOR|nr:Lysophosphatidylcholine acyltransferase [Colletotrichum orbiculare MAFF 240422]